MSLVFTFDRVVLPQGSAIAPLITAVVAWGFLLRAVVWRCGAQSGALLRNVNVELLVLTRFLCLND